MKGFSAILLAAGDPLAVPGQGAFERILEVSTPIAVDIVVAGNPCNAGNGVVPVAILRTDRCCWRRT